MLAVYSAGLWETNFRNMYDVLVLWFIFNGIFSLECQIVEDFFVAENISIRFGRAKIIRRSYVGGLSKLVPGMFLADRGECTYII